jgi:spore germination protein KA
MFSNKNEEFVHELHSSNQDILEKRIPFSGGCVWALYIRQIIDTQALSEYILKPIMMSAAESSLKAQQVMDNVIFTDENTLDENLSNVEQYIFEGKCVLLFSGEKRYVAANIRKIAQRQVSPPEFRYSLRGPRDAFIEDLDVNLSLLRKRIKDKQLKIEKMELGKRSKTKIAVLYMGDIANPKCIKEVKKRIGDIDTDIVIESGELQTFMQNNRRSIFPVMGLMEKPDQTVEKLLEGKVIILVDGACTALCAPKTFPEYFYAEDDHYEDRFFGLFMRIIRYIGLNVSLLATSIYIAMGNYHPDIMPANYIVTYAQMRARAPFPTYIAVFILEFIVELMREALLRVPVKIGSAIAIVGGIIIGQAASTSGVFTPLLLILVSIGFLATFAFPDYTMIQPFRILKFLIILLSTTYGFFGLAVGVTLILTNLVSINSFGVPYMAPYAPFNRYDASRTLIFRRRLSPKRQQYMRNIDDTRTSSKNMPGGKESKNENKKGER